MSDQTVDIWIANPSALLGSADCLNESEQRTAERMARPDLRDRAKGRRTFLRQVLGHYLRQPASSVEIYTAKDGKPNIDADLSFNMSHTNDISAIAIGQDALGLDIEPTDRRVDLDALLTKTCSLREQATIRSHPNPTLAFLDRWVRKEALLKCIGTGLIDDLPNVDPQMSQHWNGMSLYPVALDGPYVAALATNRPVAQMNVLSWPGDAARDFVNNTPDHPIYSEAAQ